MSFRLVLLFLPAILVACDRPEPVAFTEQDAESLRALDVAFTQSIINRDWSALESVYTTDAVLLPPNSPIVTGSSAIREWFAGGGLQVSEFTTDLVSIEGDGSLAVAYGTYSARFTIPPDSTEILDDGKFTWVLRREGDGEWRMAVDMFNSIPPAATP